MTETEEYRELGTLLRHREEKIPYAAFRLASDFVPVRARALWLLGEMGLAFPEKTREYVPEIAAFVHDAQPLLRERAVHALGRIGRADFEAVAPYWEDLFSLAHDEAPGVRLNFIWASENMALRHPDAYAESMQVFAAFLSDPDDKVRMEAPEMFRVVGKRRPELVLPYLETLRSLSESDENRVVRIHCLGALRTAGR